MDADTRIRHPGDRPPGQALPYKVEFFRRAKGSPSRLAIFSGAYHPPTRAHIALATIALGEVDEVVFVMPRRFPHKRYERVNLGQRMQLLLAATSEEPGFSVAITEGGLFIEIANECIEAYGPAPELWFLCGRDAAERIVNWDYGDPEAFEKQLDTFGLLVADRDGHYQPPAEFASRIRRLDTGSSLDGISATEVRTRIETGKPWEHLVPESIQDAVRKIYS